MVRLNLTIFYRSRPYSMVLSAIWFLISSCSPVNTTASTEKGPQEKAAVTSSDATNKVMGGAPSADPALSLPSWCRMNQSSDQVCFHCTRMDDGVGLEYEQCLTPSQNFRAPSDCWFSNQVTKSISCIGTRSGETFTMDVSTAKEKVSATIPVFLIALNFIVVEKFGPTSPATKFVEDISTFLGSRIQQIMRSEDLPGVAGDLAMLVNKYSKSSLSEQEVVLFKTSSTLALTWLVSSLSGKKDFDLSKVLLKVISLSQSIQDEKLGEASQFLSGRGLADLLSDNKTHSLEKVFKILGPTVAGASSAEELMSRLKQGE